MIDYEVLYIDNKGNRQDYTMNYRCTAINLFELCPDANASLAVNPNQCLKINE